MCTDIHTHLNLSITTPNTNTNHIQDPNPEVMNKANKLDVVVIQPQSKVITTTTAVEKRCKVCGEKALAFNFSALTCECCKIFFRRNALLVEKLHCRKDGHCEIDFATRKCCPRCRLDKCYAVGMRLELRRRRRPRRPRQHHHHSSPLTSTTTTTTTTLTDCTATAPLRPSPLTLKRVLLHDDNSDPNCAPVEPSPLPRMARTKHHSLRQSAASTVINCPLTSSQTLLNFVPELLTAAESALVAELNGAIAGQLPHHEHHLPCSGGATSLAQALNMPASYARRIVRLCKSLDAFRSLTAADQFALLKPFYFEFIAVWFAFLYDPGRDGFPVLENETGARTMFVHLAVCDTLEDKTIGETMRLYGRVMAPLLGGDFTARNLTIGMLLFRARANVAAAEIVCYHHHRYRSLLRRYYRHRFGDADGRRRCDRLLAVVATELDTVRRQTRAAICALDLTQVAEIVYEVFAMETW